MTKLSLIIVISLILVFIINKFKNHFEQQNSFQDKGSLNSTELKLDRPIHNISVNNNYTLELNKQNRGDLNIPYDLQFQNQTEEKLNQVTENHSKISRSNYMHTEPYKFLDEGFNNEFSLLDGILIHQFFQTKARIGYLPLLSRWVRKGKNDEFRIFMIEEIGFFNQIGCASILAGLLTNESNPEIKIAIIKTLVVLNYSKSEPQIIACYYTSDTQVKNEILKVVTIFKSKFGLKFLNELFFETQDQLFKDDLIIAMKMIREKLFEEETISSSNADTYSPSNRSHYKYQIS